MTLLSQSTNSPRAKQESDRSTKGPVLPSIKKTESISATEIEELIEKAVIAQRKEEKKLGHPIVPEDPVFKATTVGVTNNAGQKGILILDRHQDIKVLTALQEGLNQLVDVDPSKIVFIVEGSGKGIKGSEFSPKFLLENLGNKHAIPVENTIRNLSDWQVIDGVIKANLNSDPPLNRQAIVGLLALQLASSKQDLAIQNIPPAIEDVRKTWLAGDKGLSLQALYSYVDKALDSQPDTITLCSNLAMDVANANGKKEIDVRDWELVSKIVEAGEKHKPPITKEQSLGMLILFTAPSSREGSLFPLKAMNQMTESWGKQVNFEELHEAVLATERAFKKEPELFLAREQQLQKSWQQVQDSMTTTATKAVIQKYPNATHFLIISGYAHTQSVGQAFKDQK